MIDFTQLVAYEKLTDERIERRLIPVTERLDAIEQALGQIVSAINQGAGRLDAVSEQIADLGRRVDDLEAALTRIDAIDGQLARLEGKLRGPVTVQTAEERLARAILAGE